MKKKIFLCGGHVTPAIALIDELVKDASLEIVFVGRKYAVEYTLITKKGIRFLPIDAGKRTVSTLMKVPIGFFEALTYCIHEKPRLIVSFGGYVALPVAIAAWISGIPVITHEQTLVPGLTNRIIAVIAKRILVAFKETLHRFPKNKTEYIGLPMRADLFSAVKKTPYRIDEKNYPLIYITGGSQGAKSLNEKMLSAIKDLTKSYTVIHQTGPGAVDGFTRYTPEQYIPVTELSWILQHAMIVIGRSGANTTMELAALGKVAILVPLPWSAGNEQLLQAQWLAAHGGAEVIEQHALTPETLVREIKEIRLRYDEFRERAQRLSAIIPRDGAKRMAKEVYTLL